MKCPFSQAINGTLACTQIELPALFLIIYAPELLIINYMHKKYLTDFLLLPRQALQ